MRAHQILLARFETALRPYDLSFPTSSNCGCWRLALNEQVIAMPGCPRANRRHW
jgi:hypothetical protein